MCIIYNNNNNNNNNNNKVENKLLMNRYAKLAFLQVSCHKTVISYVYDNKQINK